MQKVCDWIDIEAPCEEVFETVVNIEHRMQLSPLWGLSLLLEVSPDYPKSGSRYRVRVTDAPHGVAGGSTNLVPNALAGLAHIISVKTGQAASQADVQPVPSPENIPPADGETPRENIMAREQAYVVATYEPPNKFSYFLEADCSTVITWRFQSIPRGTRVNYEEEFCDENTGGEDFLPTVQRVVREWMQNIKRYGELRGTRSRRLVKWYLDRFFLKLRPDQRRTVLLILFMHGIAIFTFVVAAIGLGIAGLFF